MIFKRKSPHQALIDRLAAVPSDESRAALVEQGEEIVEAVTKTIKRGHKGPRHRTSLIRVLGEIGPAAEPAIPVLLQAMDDEYEMVADEAGETLFHIGPSVIPHLIKQMRHEERDSGVIAIGVLTRFYGDAVPALIEALGHKSAVLRVRAAEALGEIGDPARSAKDALVAALEDKDPDVAREAQRALRRIRV